MSYLFLGDLLAGEHENCVLMNKEVELPQKDFKAEVIGNNIKRIGVNLFGENASFLAPVYKFSKDGFNTLLNEIENFVKAGNVNGYAEDAFNNISGNLKLYPLYYKGELCMEVDNNEDLILARKLFK